MTYGDFTAGLVFVSGTLRVVCLFAAAMAIHDVIRNGLHIRKVPWRARAILYFALCGFSASAMASIFRLAGESWAPMFREITHATVSLGVIGVSFLVLYARSCAGEWLNATSGVWEPTTVSGPGRERQKDETGWEDVKPLSTKAK